MNESSPKYKAESDADDADDETRKKLQETLEESDVEIIEDDSSPENSVNDEE